MPQKRRLVARDTQLREFGLFLDTFDRHVELADGVVAAPEVRSDWVLDGGVGNVQGHDIVGGALGEELEIAIDGLRDGFLGRHCSDATRRDQHGCRFVALALRRLFVLGVGHRQGQRQLFQRALFGRHPEPQFDHARNRHHRRSDQE